MRRNGSVEPQGYDLNTSIADELAVERGPATATAVAGRDRPVGPAPRAMAQGHGKVTQAGPSGRPGRRSGVTVGSARSAALD